MKSVEPTSGLLHPTWHEAVKSAPGVTAGPDDTGDGGTYGAGDDEVSDTAGVVADDPALAAVPHPAHNIAAMSSDTPLASLMGSILTPPIPRVFSLTKL